MTLLRWPHGTCLTRRRPLRCIWLQEEERTPADRRWLLFQGKVVEGFQRGSKQMGVPTANLLPTDVEGTLGPHPEGVYFGWAQLRRDGDDAVRMAVMNYGHRPTVKDGSHNTVRPRRPALASACACRVSSLLTLSPAGVAGGVVSDGCLHVEDHAADEVSRVLCCARLVRVGCLRAWAACWSSV